MSLLCNFYWSSNMQLLILLSKLLVKIKRSVFVVHKDKQKLRFWKLFTERRFCGRKLIKLKNCDCNLTPLFLYLLKKYSKLDLKTFLFLFVHLKTMIFSIYLAVKSVFFWKSSLLLNKSYCVCTILCLIVEEWGGEVE